MSTLCCWLFRKDSIALVQRRSRVFQINTKLAEMAVLASEDLTTANKKLPQVGFDLMQEIITGLRVYAQPTELQWHKFAFKSETFRSYSIDFR